MANVSLQCTCGQVQGQAVDVGHAQGSRLVCYCDDCQAFARFLGREGDILDPWGGTDIYQTAQSRVSVSRGADRIRCVRLSDKGTYRWYCGCCRTPIGNTLGPGMPFVGLIRTFLADESAADRDLGPVRGLVFTRFAIGNVPERIRKGSKAFSLALRLARKLLVWKLRGMDQPSPFFDAGGNPVAEPEVLANRPGQ